MRNYSRTVALTTLACLFLPTAAISSEARTARDSFTWSASCIELASGGSIPVENARRYIPAEYHIVGEENGTALLNVGIGRCTGMLVDGQPVPDAFTGFVAVFIEAPDGSGIHRYFLWSNGSSRRVDRRLRALGMPSIVSKEMTMETELASPLVSAEGAVPRVGVDQGGYRVSMTAPATTPGSTTLDTAYWHAGSRGLVKAEFTVTFEDEPAGPAVIQAEPGTVMSELIGGERLDGSALLARFRFDASFELIGGGS